IPASPLHDPGAMLLPGRDVPLRTFASALGKRIARADLLDYAGSVAFSALLSVFPFLIFTVSLASLVIRPAALARLLEALRRALPAEAAALLIERIRALSEGPSKGLATLGALVTIWSASGAMAALITAFDRVYE